MSIPCFSLPLNQAVMLERSALSERDQGECPVFLLDTEANANAYANTNSGSRRPSINAIAKSI